MSTVDNRVVRMQFDNAQFEAGVAKSMKTLDMLNDKLQFKEAAKGVSALQVAVSNLEGVSDDVVAGALRGLDKMASYSTTIVGKIVDQIKNDIASAVTGAIRELASIPDKAFSQIKTGGWKRASNMANAQFTVEGLGYSWEKVKDAADYAVTDTAYGLDAAAKAASQLAASGVDFEEAIATVGDRDLTQMHKALRGISGVAAMTNSSYEEIAQIFTKVAGTNRLYATELNSISMRGMNAASTLAKYLGVTEADVHELVKQGAIDFEIFANAMDDAFGEHAKEANKTFSGSFANMKAALSRIGQIFAQPVMDKTNTFFISVTGQIKKFQKALTETGKYEISDKNLKKIKKAAEDAADAYGYVGEARNQFIKKFVSDQTAEYEESGISNFATHFAEAWEAGVNAASKIVDSLDLSWFQDIGRFLDKIAIKIRDAFNAVGNAIEGTQQKISSVADMMRDTVGITLDDWKYVDRVIKGEFGNMQERWDALDKAMNEEGGGMRIQGYVDQVVAAGWSYEKLGWTEEALREQEESLTKTFEQQTKELSYQEVKYSALYNIISIVKGAIEGFKTGVKGFISSVGNIGRALGESILSITQGFREGFLSIDISGAFSRLTEGIVKFTSALRPSEAVLATFRAAGQKLSEFLGSFIERVLSAGGAIASFAADIITGKTSLSELTTSANLSPVEKFAAGFLKIISNLKKIVTNAFKSIGRVLKAFKTAFKNVFKPSGITDYLSTFTDSIANVSDMFVISEETMIKITSAFEKIFKAFQKVGNLFNSVFSKITGFFTKKSGMDSLNGKTETLVKDIADMSDEVVDVSVNAEKAEGIFTRLKIIFHDIIEYIKGSPKKIKEFYDAFKNSEGVQKLTESFSNLKIQLKDTANKLFPPVEAALSSLGAEAGTSVESVTDRAVTIASSVATGIAWVIDKITLFVEKIPEWKDAIDEFFTKIQAGATVAFDTVINKTDELGHKFGIDKLFTTISEEWDTVTAGKETIGEKVKAFTTSFLTTVSDSLEKVNWKEMGHVGMLALIGANLYKFFSILSASETLVTNIAGVPKTLSGMFKSITSIFDEAKKSVGKLTNVAMLITICYALIGLIGALVMLADQPMDKIVDAVSILTQLGLIMLLIGGAIALMNKYKPADRRTAGDNIQNSSFTLIQMSNEISGLIGAALLVASVAGSFYIALEAVADVARLFQEAKLSSYTLKNIGNTIVKIAVTLAGVTAGIMILAAIIMKFNDTVTEVEIIGKRSKKTTKKTTKDIADFVLMFAGFGVAILAMAGAVWLVVQAIATMANTKFDGGAFIAVFGMFLTVLLAAVLMVEKSKDANGKAILAMAGLIAVIAGAMYVIISQIAGLAALVALAGTLGQSEAMIISIVSILAFIPMLMLAMSSVLKNAYLVDSKSVKELGKIISAMGLAVFLMSLSIKMMVSAWAGVPDDQMFAVGLGVATSAVVMIAMLVALKKLAYDLADFYGKDVLAALSGIALVVVAIGASMWIMTEAMKNDPGLTVVSVSVGVIMFQLLALILRKLANDLKGIETEQLVYMVGSIAALMLVMAASVVIMGIAATLMSSAGIGGVIGAIVSMALMLGAFYIILKSLSKLDVTSKKMEALTDMVGMIGASMLMIAISAMAFAKACQMMQTVDPDAYTRVLIPIAAMLGVFTILAAVLGIMAAGGRGAGVSVVLTVLQELGNVMLKVGVSMALMGASVLLLGAGVGILGGGLGKLAEGVSILAKTFSEHKATVFILLVIIGLITAAVAYFIKMAAPFEEVVGAVGAGVAKTTGGIKEKLTEAFKGMKNVFSMSTTKLKKWWKDLSPKIKVAIVSTLVTVTGAIASATPEALKNFGTMIFEVLKWLISLAPKLIGWIVEFLIVILNGLADAIRSKAARLVAAISNVIEALVEVIVHAFASAIIALLRAFDVPEEIISGITDSTATIVKSLRKGQKDIESYAESFDRIMGETDEFKKETDSAVKSVKKETNAIDDLKSSLGGLFNIGGNDSSNLLQGFDISNSIDMDAAGMNEFQKYLGGLDESYYDIGEGNGEAYLQGFDISKSLDMDAAGMNEFQNYLSGLDESYYTTGNEGGEAYGSGFENYFNTDGAELAYDNGATYTDEFASGIDNIDSRDQVEDATENLMGVAEQVISDKKTELVETTIPDMMEEVASAMKDGMIANSETVNEGAKTLVDGIVKVISSRLGATEDEVEDAAEEFSDIFNNGPSTKATTTHTGPSSKPSTARNSSYKTGYELIKGLEDGINDNSYLASDAMTNVSEKAAESFTEPLVYAGKVASGELEYDPTVRPVMDMSDVLRGSVGVRSMFRNQSISLSGLSGQIAYDMTNLNGSNAAVVSEIQALREDMDFMTDELTNMQIIMDTGALVGSTVGAYDQALGSRQVYSKRGTI